MSKKKRNRRHPSPSAMPPGSPDAGSAVAVLEERQDDDADAGAKQDEETAVGGAPALMGAQAGGDDASPPDATLSSPSPQPVAASASAPLAANASSWTPQESGDIRGVLIQIVGGRLLLPNATIAEVLSYAEPEPVESSAEWLLGRFRWRGWQLPLVAFSHLAGIGEEQPGLGSKVIVLKALGGDRRIPYFAILTQGFPRLVTVSRSALEVEGDGGELPVAIQARVRLNDEPALLPDLLRIEQMLHADREAA